VERIYQTRLQETCALHGVPGRHIHLATISNEDFLENASNLHVARYIKHDRIHEIVAYTPNVPVYTRCKRDLSKAQLDKAMFFALPLVDQIRDVREEAMVIAIERYLLPACAVAGGGSSAQIRILTADFVKVSYERAVERICTTLTKGWFRDFAINHFPDVKRCDRDLLTLLQTVRDEIELNLAHGLLKSFQRLPDVLVRHIYSFYKGSPMARNTRLQQLFQENILDQNNSDDMRFTTREISLFTELIRFADLHETKASFVGKYSHFIDNANGFQLEYDDDDLQDEPFHESHYARHIEFTMPCVRGSYRSFVVKIEAGERLRHEPYRIQQVGGILVVQDYYTGHQLLRINRTCDVYYTGGSSDGCEYSEKSKRREDVNTTVRASEDSVPAFDTFGITTMDLVRFVCALLQPEEIWMTNVKFRDQEISSWFYLWRENVKK